MFLFVEKAYFAVKYFDDFGGVSTVTQAWEAFSALGELLRAAGIHEASEKAFSWEYR